MTTPCGSNATQQPSGRTGRPVCQACKAARSATLVPRQPGGSAIDGQVWALCGPCAAARTSTDVPITPNRERQPPPQLEPPYPQHSFGFDQAEYRGMARRPDANPAGGAPPIKTRTGSAR